MNRLNRLFRIFAVFVLFTGCNNAFAESDVTVGQLTCEYLANPMGIDVTNPRLSWILESSQRGQRQTAYQVLVASSEDNLKHNKSDLWDSGKVTSEQSIHIVYAGKPLKSRQRCWWKVSVWDKDGSQTAFSEPGFWEMGLLEKSDWRAKWLSISGESNSQEAQPSPFFRREFAAANGIKKARAYISGLGYYELYLNGQRVGDHVLDPAFTRYDKRVLYAMYDVTNRLKEGKNAVGIVLGNGWYFRHNVEEWDFHKSPWRARPTFICQIEIEFVDGSTDIIASDAAWKVSTGPIIFDSIRNGEIYDARLEMPGWNAADYNDSGWKEAQVVDGPKGKLCAQMLPPIKVVKEIAPVNLTEPKPGVFVFDMGQNFAGWAQLKVSGPAGAKVTLKYGDVIDANGTIDQKRYSQLTRQGFFQTDMYTLKGEGTEIWEPRFTYYGFQYVEVTGFPGKPVLDNLRGKVIHTSFESAGRFECSNGLLNKIQQATLWSYISNFQGYPTDCPHREKNGWTGDAQLACEMGLYNFDSASAYTKWMNDFKDEQRENGMLPGIVPTGGWGYDITWMKGPQWRSGFGPAWDSAYVLIPWYMYQYCGDTRILAEHYNGMKRYVDFLTDKSPDGICWLGLGDWCPATEQTDKKVTSTGFYYGDAIIVSKVARLLGKDEEARKYADLAEKIKQAFNSQFFDANTSRYAQGTQTANSCALYYGLVDTGSRQKVLENLIANIERHNGHLDAGILGVKYLLNSLTEAGRADVVYRMASQTTYPSWGHWISRGATTLWESWDGRDSRNHIMFGPISEWFYKALAGISAVPEYPGFKQIFIHPQPVGDLVWAKAEHKSPYGLVKSGWRKEAGKLILEVVIPPNTTGIVYVPTGNADTVTEGGVAADKAEGVKPLRTEPGTAVFNVGSGKYKFESSI